MAAHRGEALVVDEENGEVGIGMVGSDREDAVHIGVASRFMHQHSSEVIEALGGIPTFGENRGAFDLWEAVGDDSNRFATGVHLDCMYANGHD
jgi:hypothetical protein